MAYTIVLKNGAEYIISAQRVIEKGGLVRFCNDRKSLSDQYFNGPKIVAAFNVDEVLFFKQQ